MTLDEFLRQLCVTAGWPSLPTTLAVMAHWAHLEGIDNPKGLGLDRGWNPWMTTWPDGPTTPRTREDIGFGPGKWNNANPPLGVGMYAGAAAGIQATILTLTHNPAFVPILATFARGAYQEGFAAAITAWIGDPGYSADLDAFARATYGAPPAAPPAPPALTLADVIAFLGGEAAIREWNAKGNSLALGFAAVQAQSQETANRVAVVTAPTATLYSDLARIVTQAGTAIDAAGRARGG